MAKDVAAYAAGLAQGRADVANRVSSMAPSEYASSQDYADGYAAGSAQASDPQSYADGEQQGLSDTVNRVSSAPPAFADETHYDYPGTPADSYNKGYEAGASAPPDPSAVEAKEKADQEARDRSMRNSMPTFDPTIPLAPVGPPQTSMSPITEEEEERSKRYTEEKEANERYFELHKDWEDELKRTTPEDVTGQPLAD